MPVKPDCQGIVNLLPGSKVRFKSRGAAFLAKLGSFDGSSSVNHETFVRFGNSAWPSIMRTFVTASRCR